MSIRIEKKRAQVNDLTMAYVELGEGAPMVFLHGNPTSSFLWRNVIAPLAPRFRCIAPDLVGMGDSDRLARLGPGTHGFFDQRPYLDAFLDIVVDDEPIVLVLHDWGSALGFDWARRHPDRVRGIAYMEAITGPLSTREWEPGPRAAFEKLRSPAGEAMVLDENFFVERILPASILRTLSPEEMHEYRRPFLERGEARRPTLTLPRELPLDGEPAAIVAVVREYAAWLAETRIPKLFVNADPGRVLVGEARETCRRWPEQTEVTVAGKHFLQEDSPREIADAIARWSSELPL
ncbi:haloalkane dehalogenase [Minicystis rosea]|nr:haloalkane dehalogenase [Minicystis rosea]